MHKFFSYKSTVKCTSIALVAALTLSLTACDGQKDSNTDNTETQEAEVVTEPKLFKKNGLNITLTSDYIQSPNDSYTFYFSNPYSICIGLEEKKADLKSTNISAKSLNDYANIVMEKAGITAEITDYNNSKLFKWNKKINDTDYSYIGYVTESDDSFWLIQFACLSEEYADYESDFIKCFDSITFDEIEVTPEPTPDPDNPDNSVG